MFLDLVINAFDNKKITVNTKTESSSKVPVDEKNSINNTVLNASLINLGGLIQKILEENRKLQENDLNEFNSNNNSNNLVLTEVPSQNQSQNINVTKNKNIEVNKKVNKKKSIDNLKKNNSNRILGSSPNKNKINRNFYSNFNINPLSNMKGFMTSSNTTINDFIRKEGGPENSQGNVTQDEKNIKNFDHSEFLEYKARIKMKKNFNNKTLNTFDYKKNINNLNGKKSETVKNLLNNNKIKNEISLKKIRNNYITNVSVNKSSNSKSKNHTKKLIDNNATSEESKIKEENKESFINKNNKVYKIGNRNNINPNVNNNNNKERNSSKQNTKKCLTQNNTKPQMSNQANKSLKEKEKEKALIKHLSPREQSYYLLSKSPILRLKERILFSRSTEGLRKVQKISDILKDNQAFLKDKLKELKEKIAECDKRVNTSFTPSKTAEINFNFILTKDEDEFKNFVWFAENEKEKEEYYCFIKILYLLMNENYENIELKQLNEKLGTIIVKKGYKSIKDYIYNIYFKKNDNKNKNNNIVFHIDKINSLLEEAGINKKFDLKFCRFALFTSFVIGEIIKYGNEIKSTMELKIKTKELIDVVNNILENYKTDKIIKKK